MRMLLFHKALVAFKDQKIMIVDWGYGSVAECVPSVHEDLGPILSTTNET